MRCHETNLVLLFHAMDVITGGASSATSAELDRTGQLSEQQQRIADALLECMRRWGLAKTTMDDVAKEARISRATLYRLFPGGKQEILDVAAQAAARAIAEQLSAELSTVQTLEQCLVRAVHSASSLLADDEVVEFLRTREPAVLKQVLSFEHLDGIFAAYSPLLRPRLERFLAPDVAAEVTVWLARIVVSHLKVPSTSLDLSDLDDVRTLIASFVLPGLVDRTVAEVALA